MFIMAPLTSVNRNDITAATAIPDNDCTKVLVFLLAMCVWIKKADVFPKSIKKDIGTYKEALNNWLSLYKISTKNSAKLFSDLGKDADIDDENIDVVIESIRDKWARISKDTTISQQQLNGLKDTCLYLTKDSQPAWKRLEATCAKITKIPDILEGFAPQSTLPKDTIPKLEKLVYSLTGKTGNTIPLEQLAKIRESKPEQYATYLELRKLINVEHKTNLRNLCRTDGDDNHTVDVQEVRDMCKRQKMPNIIPDGFVGRIDEDNSLYTSSGKKLSSRPQFPIKMNPLWKPNTDNTYVGIVVLPTKDANGNNNVQHIYTTSYKVGKAASKELVVDKLIKNEEAYRAKWLKDLKGPMSVKKICAAVVELSYQTCSRIGTPGASNKSGATYGLSTIPISAVSKQGANRRVRYVGKKSVVHSFVVQPTTTESKQIISVIDNLIKDRPRTELLFYYERKAISATVVRAYWKIITGMDVGIHKIRTMRGTKMATELLDALLEKYDNRTNLSQSEVDKQFKQTITQVGELLGHVKGIGGEETPTWTTASQSYISSTVQKSFYEKLAEKGIRVPTFISKLTEE